MFKYVQIYILKDLGLVIKVSTPSYSLIYLLLKFTYVYSSYLLPSGVHVIRNWKLY